jgi:hypothetical protein
MITSATAKHSFQFSQNALPLVGVFFFLLFHAPKIQNIVPRQTATLCWMSGGEDARQQKKKEHTAASAKKLPRLSKSRHQFVWLRVC